MVYLFYDNAGPGPPYRNVRSSTATISLTHNGESPSILFWTGPHRDFHRVTDEAQYIDYPHMSRIMALVRDVAVHIGNLYHRPRLDKPEAKVTHTAPCPNGL